MHFGLMLSVGVLIIFSYITLVLLLKGKTLNVVGIVYPVLYKWVTGGCFLFLKMTSFEVPFSACFTNDGLSLFPNC